jgi:hypothetical protein
VAIKKEDIHIRVTPEFKGYAEKACRVLGFNSIQEFLKASAIAFGALQGIKPDEV